MALNITLLLAGFIVLVKGADWLVNGASALARKYRVSDLAIGLTIVAFGTSAPELVVNGFAAINNSPDIVFGNVIGSNNFNLFIILGFAGVITPIAVQSSSVWKEIPLSFLAILILFILGNDFHSEANMLTRIDGIILLLFFFLFIIYVYRQMKRDKTETVSAEKSYTSLKIWILISAGLGGLVLGGKLVVTNAIEMATSLGVSEKIIASTIVAAGTSLPELATSVVAAVKKNNDIAVGNIIGSNIFNIFLILSVSSLIRPLDYSPAFNSDLFMLAAGTLFVFIAMFTGGIRKLDRAEAAFLLAAYAGYTIYILSL